MAGNIWWKNLTGTVCVLSLAFSSTDLNSTQLINGVEDILETAHTFNDVQEYVSINSVMSNRVDNIYIQPKRNKLDAEAQSLFGQMRCATVEEIAGVDAYIKDISKDTGVDFFDLC